MKKHSHNLWLVAIMFLILGFLIGLVIMNSAITGHQIFSTSWTIPSQTIVIDDGPLINQLNDINNTNISSINITSNMTIEQICEKLKT